jgi:CBS domain-containing protein
MLDEPVRKIMRKNKMLTTRPGELVAKAAQRMARRNVGALLVLEDGRLVGIVTERDVVFRVVAGGLDATTTRVAEIMTRNPITIEADLPFGSALVVMHREGFRHLPVMKDGKAVGIISARSALDPELEEFTSEASRRRHFAQMAARVKSAR